MQREEGRTHCALRVWPTALVTQKITSFRENRGQPHAFTRLLACPYVSMSAIHQQQPFWDVADEWPTLA